MKKLLLVCAAFFLGFLLFPKPTLAQSCVCNVDSNRTTYIQTPCGDGYVSQCTGNPWQGTLGCKCTAEDVGVNCTTEGLSPTSSKPCCSPLVPFNYGQGTICKQEGLDPYHNCMTTGKPNAGQNCCAGSKLNDQGECVVSSAFGSVDVSCDNNTGVKTAIGCIHVLKSGESFLADILKWAVGIGGGIAFLLMLYAGFMLMTASGNPERIKAGQELMTSAIAGLILLIFSVFILKFIGVDILGLGKFGFGG